MSRAKRLRGLSSRVSGDMPKESMLLSAGYLNAAALADEKIRDEMNVRIFNFGGGDSLTTMAETVFSHGVPDVLAFSVFGWNYRAFSARRGVQADAARRLGHIRRDACGPLGRAYLPHFPRSTSSRTARAT